MIAAIIWHSKNMSMTVRRTLCLIVLIAAIAGLSRIQARMNRLRESAKLVDTNVLVNAPPLVAFTTVAMGGLRGLLADALFLRLRAMQEQENFFEMVQLSHWIVDIQPRFTAVSSFLAWNMAYNVSVMFRDPDHRWRWVRHGIALIRDEALRYNPDAATLYRDLGWLYQHKIGHILDDANQYYKAQLADEVTTVVGSYTDEAWEQLAAAPESVDALQLAIGPERWSSLLAAMGSTTLAQLEVQFRRTGQVDSLMLARIGDGETAQLLERHWRRRWLQEQLKLDPRRVAALIHQYGPLDFRLPEAHAIYWATLGLAAAGGSDLSCERMIFQSLKAAFVAGRRLQAEGSDLFVTVPNVRLADSVRNAYRDSMERHPDNQSVHGGYENFMVEAIVILYTFGKIEKARDYLDAMRRDENYREHPRYRASLDEFVLHELAGDLTTLSASRAQAMIQALILQGLEALAFGDDARAAGFERVAASIHQRYMATLGNGRDRERRGLPEFQALKAVVREQFEQSYPRVLTKRLDAAAGKSDGYKEAADKPFLNRE